MASGLEGCLSSSAVYRRMVNGGGWRARCKPEKPSPSLLPGGRSCQAQMEEALDEMRGGGECAVTGAQHSSSPHLHAHAPALEGKPVRHSIISQLDSLLALSIHHPWMVVARRAIPAFACSTAGLRRRAPTTTLPPPLSTSFLHCICTCLCLSPLCLHPRRQLPSAHVPPSPPVPPPISPTHPSPTRHLAAVAERARARTRSVADRRTSLLTCRAVIIVALRTRKACLLAALSAPAHS